MAGVAELIDRGIKLYMAGRIREAREAFQLALDLEPGDVVTRTSVPKGSVLWAAVIWCMSYTSPLEVFRPLNSSA